MAVCTGLPVTLVFLPAADIAAYVGTFWYVCVTYCGSDRRSALTVRPPAC